MNGVSYLQPQYSVQSKYAQCCDFHYSQRHLRFPIVTEDICYACLQTDHHDGSPHLGGLSVGRAKMTSKIWKKPL